MLRSSFGLSIISLLITGLSFLNQIALANFFGSSPQMTSYLLAYSAPAVLIGILNMLFSFGMVPVLATYKASDPQRYHHLLGTFALTVLLLATLIAGLGVLFSPFQVRQLSPGLEPEMLANTILMSRFFWVTAGVSTCVAFLTSALNVSRRFAIPLSASALPYVGMLAMTVFYGKTWGSVATALGMLLGTAVAAVWLLLPAFRDFQLAEGDLKSSLLEVGHFLARAPIVLLAMLCFCSISVTDAYWAPRVAPELLAHLGYAQRILLVMVTLLAFGPSAVLTPRLVELRAHGSMPGFRADAAKALRMIVAISAPMALVIILLRFPIIEVLFQRGSFDRASTAGVGTVLPWILLGVIPMASSVVLMKALFAMEKTMAAGAIGGLQAVSYFVLAGLLSQRFHGIGFGMAFALAWWGAFAGLLLVLWKGHLQEFLAHENVQFVLRLVPTLAAVGLLTVLSGAVFLSGDSLHIPVLGMAPLFLRLALVLTLVAVTFVGSAVYLFKLPELLLLKDMIGGYLGHRLKW